MELFFASRCCQQNDVFRIALTPMRQTCMWGRARGPAREDEHPADASSDAQESAVGEMVLRAGRAERVFDMVPNLYIVGHQQSLRENLPWLWAS
jgi:hypothetical protein